MGDKIILHLDAGEKELKLPQFGHVHIIIQKWIIESYKEMNEYEIEKSNFIFIGRGRFNDAHIIRNYLSK